LNDFDSLFYNKNISDAIAMKHYIKRQVFDSLEKLFKYIEKVTNNRIIGRELINIKQCRKKVIPRIAEKWILN